jgi:tetratricopeptide (TPR) repeat protein
LHFQGSLERSISFLEEATRLDPEYAEAYAALADACIGLARSGRPGAEWFPRASASAGKALELDPSSAEALNALANVRFWFDWNWPEAERNFRRALAANPSYAPGHHDYAWFLVAMGRTETGLRSLRRAIALDPFSVRVNMDAGWLFLQAHRFDDAILQARRALELSPGLDEAQACIGTAEYYLGRASAPPRTGSDPYSLAARLASKDSDGAISALEQAYQSHSMMMPLLNVDPAFRTLHENARFLALTGKMGIK